ncbi:MAG: hypothetical protein COW52_06670 [Nitrospirae bacterium CG17_big_fil_post_rev_8_21_14_2_50_50_9]|nr:MAG: hypothetical protein COW52_06670 [Nitrospirae bacterium CG17_big_fil_post_rev_8_21_14_2_50_50_9]PIW84418.1 MAG: hypothetical protein COZ95_09915 [Nitrospirae bacterium CG_4_8_14_3_um_filter_50_41]
MNRKILRHLPSLFGIILFAVALFVLHHALEEYHYHDVIRSLKGLPAQKVVLAVLLTLFSYMAMVGYDMLALHYIRHPLAYSKIAFASFISYAFSSNIGISILSASAIRYRLYSAWGLSTEKITHVVAFCILTFWLGYFTLTGAVLLLEPIVIPAQLHLPVASGRLMSAIFAALVIGYLLTGVLRKKPVRIGEWEFPVPSFRLFISQIMVASADWILAGAVLYVLLPASGSLSFLRFIGIFMVAQLTGLISHVPGGIGVFETVMIFLLAPDLAASDLLSSLLVYRVIYYFLPLSAATVMLGSYEIIKGRERVKRVTTLLGQWFSLLAPQALSFTTFVGGAILLISGATPAEKTRLAWLNDFLPLPVMEMSHFLGSLAGVGLIILARGIQRRLDAAYILVLALLGTGIVFSLLKGFDYEEAILLTLMFGALLPCHRYFYRKASLFSQRFTAEWIAAIAFVLMGSIWIGLFAYKHLEYSHELWWQFALSGGDAPRFLRATVGVMVVVLIFSTAKLLQPGSPEPSMPDHKELDRAHDIITDSRATSANLALLGDKPLLFSESGNAFIMYAVEGRSWVAMGDPVGPQPERTELIWRFRELCDRHDGWTVFYEVDVENLPLYVELGLTLLKLGEEARVPLEAFSIEGKARSGLRYIVNRLEKEKFEFSVVPSQGVPRLIPELKEISDAWLTERKTREKRFSLGFFDEAYLRHFPVGTVLKEGRIVAFANLWTGAGKEEISIDLMRHLPDTPNGIMDFLFTHILLWGKAQGYQWFNLGMAPLSGLENRAFAPIWNRLGSLIFRHGENFYNFQGLRQYKEKFDPVWRPKYLASPGGLALPRILANLSSLISGGLKGIITK